MRYLVKGRDEILGIFQDFNTALTFLKKKRKYHINHTHMSIWCETYRENKQKVVDDE